jgi:hypothetical protein
MDRGPAGESTVDSLVKRTIVTFMHSSGNQSLSSSTAYNLVEEVVEVAWREKFQLPRLVEPLEEDPTFHVLPACNGARKIQLKPQPHVPFHSGAGTHACTSFLTTAAPAAAEAAAGSSNGATPTTDWDLSNLIHAVDWAWPNWKSSPQEFLKHALAKQLVERSGPGTEHVKLHGPQAGTLNQAPRSSCLDPVRLV